MPYSQLGLRGLGFQGAASAFAFGFAGPDLSSHTCALAFYNTRPAIRESQIQLQSSCTAVVGLQLQQLVGCSRKPLEASNGRQAGRERFFDLGVHFLLGSLVTQNATTV